MNFDLLPYDLKTEILNKVIINMSPSKNFDSLIILKKISSLSNQTKTISNNLIENNKLYLSRCWCCAKRQAKIFHAGPRRNGECNFCWTFR